MEEKQAAAIFTLALMLSACGSDEASLPDATTAEQHSAIPQHERLITHNNWQEILTLGIAKNGFNDFSPQLSSKLRSSTSLIKPFIATTPLYTRTASLRNDLEMNCDTGKLKLTAEDLNNNGVFESGDSYTILYTDCYFRETDLYGEVDTLLLNGSITMTANAGAENSDHFNITSTFDLDIGDDTGLYGSFEFDTAKNGSITTTVLHSENFLFREDYEFTSMEDYSLTATFDETLLDWAETYSVSIASTSIEGKVVIATTKPLIGSNASYPDSGEILIQGGMGSYLSLDANTGDNETVKATIFDGQTTQTHVLSWDIIY